MTKPAAKSGTKKPARVRQAANKAKPAAADPPPIADEIVDRVVLLLVTIRSRADVLRQCVENARLALTVDQAAAAMAEATRRISAAAAYALDDELGAARIRLAELFARASKVQDFKTALAIQKETNKLLALYQSRTAAAGGSATTAADDTAGETTAALAELAAARAHLATLLPAKPDENLADLARRVVGLFVARPK